MKTRRQFIARSSTFALAAFAGRAFAAEDDAALGILREQFKDRKIIGVPGRVLAKGGGGVHCITQQIPA